MKLTEQVCGLDLAKRLKELGCTQGDWESAIPILYWSYYDGGARRDKTEPIVAQEFNFRFMGNIVAAFTVAELGKLLPTDCWSRRANGGEHFWWCSWDDDTNEWHEYGNTEADARLSFIRRNRRSSEAVDHSDSGNSRAFSGLALRQATSASFSGTA
jgi:hypothetical protein